ncbi:unnamed protein product [Strongylus vulgaris]|uniref:CUE domain-containing protein n=1 Tax=Strongylus vulgaris TaxID=40348 RepID=A0A3P7KEL1_STRVU|nr:unnamed protein product [Strongylus vulgaris]
MSKVAEKKLINEKIAKVREVVHGVSTNDIILALHSFDMNVERTIQAFCEADGASEVLDDWVRPTSGSSKNKNKKKKSKLSTTEATAGAVTSSTPSPSKVVKTPPTQETKPIVASTASQLDSKAPQTNGFVIQAKPLEVKPSNDKNTPVAEHIQQTFKALRAAVTGREKTLLAACGANSKFIDADFNHLISLIEKFGSGWIRSYLALSA